MCEKITVKSCPGNEKGIPLVYHGFQWSWIHQHTRILRPFPSSSTASPSCFKVLLSLSANHPQAGSSCEAPATSGSSGLHDYLPLAISG